MKQVTIPWDIVKKNWKIYFRYVKIFQNRHESKLYSSRTQLKNVPCIGRISGLTWSMSANMIITIKYLSRTRWLTWSIAMMILVFPIHSLMPLMNKQARIIDAHSNSYKKYEEWRSAESIEFKYSFDHSIWSTSTSFVNARTIWVCLF